MYIIGKHSTIFFIYYVLFCFFVVISGWSYVMNEKYHPLGT